MDLVFLRSLFTVLVFVTFIGVWIWAWSSKRKQAFDEAANLPFADDKEHKATINKENLS